MNKEERNNFVIPLPHWLARYMPHVFFTPQNILEKPGRKPRQISDASKRYTPTSTPINMMTSTPHGSEEKCLFGNTLEQILTRIYNLRVTFPDLDIVVHANDVKSAFRQIKLHPDIMGAFSYIIADKLFLSCGLPFGTDFSPANWEVLRQILEELAKKLFDDPTLVDKHRKYLDSLKYDRALGKIKIPVTKAVMDKFNQGVLDKLNKMYPTLHFYYVDDGIYAEIYEKSRIERAAAASIEAIFLLLGESDLSKRQDPISFDKLMEMVISYINKVLGHELDTRRLTISTPRDYINEVKKLLSTTWGPHRKQFTVQEAAELTGKLGFMSISAPWLKFLMTHLYASMANALRLNRAHLIRSNRQFRSALRQLRQADRMENPEDQARVKTFYQGETARAVHKNKKTYWINGSMRRELQLIRRFIQAGHKFESPMAHLIQKTPAALADSDSSLNAAGGFCTKLKFWWYIEWPEEVKMRTLRHVKSRKDGKLIDINVLEYAAILINFLAASFCLRLLNYFEYDPHPIMLLQGDNTASKAWLQKGSKHSPVGRALGQIQCAFMLDNPVGVRFAHVDTKSNVIADNTSRVIREADFPRAFLDLCQKHPELVGCRRFHPSSEIVSCIMDAILSEECIDPVRLNKLLLTAPGRITS